MVWGFLRIVIFGTAFLAGTIITDVVQTDVVQSKSPPEIPSLKESAGTSLVVVCDEGGVVVTPLAGGSGAVQLDCAQSEMLVVRHSKSQAAVEKIPGF